ncbi:LANO_0E03246g1_1 [Lachancea nothofagi CBS 11611]|uniref:LANO_0E03246g1_1 n=1 Tax=Lachancea nothofagi CBS 11611 TaxID=1266666 RepID=A0A1G4JQW0_9SACH|nr:LANO_0E03246g1_1 [Lachancea nothofagi CBS 11611]
MTTIMSLKVLYTVDRETSPYLTRSKTPVEVRVEDISSPSNDGSQIKIGMVVLNDVLAEICASSPELFSLGVDSNMDYNVYCRDICEMEEPLVSYGLLSKLRNESQQRQAESDALDANWPLVIGRVCSNFSAMLRFQNASSSPQNLQQTLEIKMRFSKVATANSSRRSSISNKSAVMPMLKKTPSMNLNGVTRRFSKTTELGKPNEPAPSVVAKRLTNPKPAPKAVRTQSLPIWNQDKNNQFALPTNSIAHKIYLADRAAKDTYIGQKQGQDKKPIYQISTLQQDNSVHKTKIDDSVSKRFDFITKKKGKMGKPSMKKPVTKTKSNNITKKVRRDSIPNTSTPLANELQTNNKSDELEDYKLLGDDDLVQQLLGRQKMRPVDYLEADQPGRSEESDNKENIPPRMTLAASRFEDLIGMDIPSSKSPSDIEKALANPRSDDPMEWFNDLFGSPLLSQKTTTPTKDPLTCNTLPIEDEEQDAAKAPTSDMDRTSPMDTLSMPLYELEQRKQVTNSKLIPSCKDQLRRLPLLSRPHNEHSSHDAEDDATSVLNFSTPSNASNHSMSGRNKRPAPVPSSPVDDEDYLDEYMQETRRKRKALPSSPTSMFQYQGVHADEEMANENTINNEEFSIHERPGRSDADSTPATQYRSSDGENTKHGEDNHAISDREVPHI